MNQSQMYNYRMFIRKLWRSLVALLVSSLVCYQNNKNVLPFTLFSIIWKCRILYG